MTYSTNPVARKHAALTLTSNYADIVEYTTDASDTRSPSTLSPSSSLKYSNDSLSSFEDYRIGYTHTAVSPTYIYFKCAVPTSSISCTGEFISAMCCSCGRG